MRKFIYKEETYTEDDLDLLYRYLVNDCLDENDLDDIMTYDEFIKNPDKYIEEVKEKRESEDFPPEEFIESAKTADEKFCRENYQHWDWAVRQAIAWNKNCPDEILIELFEDEDEDVRKAVSENPKWNKKMVCAWTGKECPEKFLLNEYKCKIKPCETCKHGIECRSAMGNTRLHDE